MLFCLDYYFRNFLSFYGVVGDFFFVQGKGETQYNTNGVLSQGVIILSLFFFFLSF